MAYGRRRMVIGKVVSDKMDKTIVVLEEKLVQHPRYKKYVRRRKKFYAHDPQNSAKVGDVVKIVEWRPLSRLKRWHLVEIIERAKEKEEIPEEKLIPEILKEEKKAEEVEKEEEKIESSGEEK